MLLKMFTPRRRDIRASLDRPAVRPFVADRFTVRDLEDACEIDVDLGEARDIEELDVSWNELDVIALWAKRASRGWQFVASWKVDPTTLNGAHATCRQRGDRAVVTIPRAHERTAPARPSPPLAADLGERPHRRRVHAIPLAARPRSSGPCTVRPSWAA